MTKPADGDDEPVPRIPRTKGFKLPMSAVIRIALTGAMLAMIIVARRPCADSVSSFVTNMDNTGSGSAATQMPKPGNVDVPQANGSAGDYEPLRSDMTEAEIKAAMERAKAKARAAALKNEERDSGSNGSGSAGSGSATH